VVVLIKNQRNDPFFPIAMASILLTHFFNKRLGRSIIPEKSFDPRKTRKARKYSKGYKIVSRHLKGERLCKTTY